MTSAAVAGDQCPQHDQVDRVLDETAPSRRRTGAWNPPGAMAAQFASQGLDGSSLAGSPPKGISVSGLVQGTASRASTTAIVIEVPSVIDAICDPLGDLRSKNACSPEKPR